MDKEKAKELIHKKVRNEYKKIHGNKNLKRFYNSLLDISRKSGLEAYIACLEGAIYNLEKNNPDALDCFKTATGLDGDLVFAWYGLGVVYFEEQEYDQAIQAYDKAMEIDGTFVFSLNGLGNVYLAQKEYGLAAEAYDKALEIDEKFVFSMNGMGNLHFALEEYDAAIREYESAIDLDKKYAHPWNGCGHAYEVQTKNSKAVEAYKKAIKLDGNWAPFWFDLGNMYYGQQEYKQAIKAYKNAIKIDENHAYSWAYKGISYRALKEFEPAIDALNKAINLDGNSAFFRLELGGVYFDQGEHDRAITTYKTAMEVDKNSGEPWLRIGYVYYALGKFSLAIEAYNKSINLSKTAATYYWLGSAHYIQKEYDDAIEAYNSAIELDQTEIYPFYWLGNAYYLQGKFDQAIKAYTKAKEVDEAFPYLWNGLGSVYYWQGNSKKAITHYNKSIELHGEFAHSFSGLGSLYKDMGKFDDAIKKYEKAGELYRNMEDHYWADYCAEEIRQIELMIKAENSIFETTESDRTLKILKETKKLGVPGRAEKLGIEGLAEENKKLYDEFTREKPLSVEKGEPYFQVLRRWNSYTPIVADNYHISKGGGYFLKTGGRGIVIDPGFNFIDNFKGMGHSFSEIDAVIISHAHNDHAADLESILTLLYRYNNAIKENIKKQLGSNYWVDLSKDRREPYAIASEEDVEKAFLESRRRKTIELYLTKSTYTKYQGMLRLDSDSYYNINIIDQKWAGNLCGVKVKALPAKHHDAISDRDSLGFIFSIDNTAVVYTGDTGWNDDIEKSYKHLANDAKDNDGEFWYKEKTHKILVAHLGGFKACERNYVIKDARDSSYYKNHLGRIGMVKINETLSPDVCFISEFGEELKGQRVALAEIFNNEFEETEFLPADIGLTIRLKNKKIKAIHTINESTLKCTYRDIEPKDVCYQLLKKDYSLNYFSDAKIVDPTELAQFLGALYDKSMQ